MPDLMLEKFWIPRRLKKFVPVEVAIGFGLRHQAVADKADGLPVDYVDPTEGNYSLTESMRCCG